MNGGYCRGNGGIAHYIIIIVIIHCTPWPTPMTAAVVPMEPTTTFVYINIHFLHYYYCILFLGIHTYNLTCNYLYIYIYSIIEWISREYELASVGGAKRSYRLYGYNNYTRMYSTNTSTSKSHKSRCETQLTKIPGGCCWCKNKCVQSDGNCQLESNQQSFAL